MENSTQRRKDAAQRRRMAENKISKVKVDAAILPIYLTTEPMIGNRQR
jgi:hypothetical protein